MQRAFDIFFSGLALLIFSPFLLPIVIALRLTGEGEVFYLQERIGRGGKPFMLYKFATMLKNSPSLGTGTITMKNDPRILPMGHFLRKTKINELPQLLNIFFGDMSVIGPRPLTSQTFGAYSVQIQASVVKVRPGLSGIGSIVFRQEEEILAGEAGSIVFYREIVAPYKGALEEWYVNNQNLITYFMAIFITVWAVLSPNSSIIWRVFRGLPSPPNELRTVLNYPV
ncbi:sugar transferase [Chromobacterium haemolyticum]|uniref:Lipid carrier--UDP-N-acetylgalactosaminyltransferase n=1 Tax=Chromobacterium haemolyticum TaxID=394935 RepID=A0A1W0CV37_9NEIS|nr:sugar transferase [Chromobacterium haemolyticum]OQS38630.1 lipid carrier--UDP-N-acetylgalactosaminyltransferase [Chromobacterium haemolyticum]